MFNLPLCPLSLDKVQSRVHHCINASTFVFALVSALVVNEDQWVQCNTLEVHTCGAVEGTLSRHGGANTTNGKTFNPTKLPPSNYHLNASWQLFLEAPSTFATTSSFMQIPPVALHFESFTCAWCPSCALLRPVTCNLQLFGLQGESEIQFSLQ